MNTLLKPPIVIHEVDDSDYDWFEDIRDVLEDKFDCLWGSNYEGWDSTGRRFEVVRKEPLARWWEKFLKIDTTYLKIEKIYETNDDIRDLIIHSLKTVGIYTEEELKYSNEELIEKILQHQFTSSSTDNRKLWSSYDERISKC
ncbi:MAG: hypothetical protein OEZ58_15640 [Gammaproteobacteria bacterium]|nr:hypothetical protein [Gammaproteobacteria bacterium]